jgi:hypothetical protein
MLLWGEILIIKISTNTYDSHKLNTNYLILTKITNNNIIFNFAFKTNPLSFIISLFIDPIL